MADVIVRSLDNLRQEIAAGPHTLFADEPALAGGDDSGPDPYELLLAALGACTSMTLLIYARRKRWPLEGVEVRLSHRRDYARDCAECEETPVLLDLIERRITLRGALDDTQRARLLEIAAKCPALAMRLRVSVLLVGGLVAALFLIVYFTFPAYSDAWISVAILFAAIVFGFGCVGIVIRRFVRQFARTTVEIEDAAAQRGKLEQRMDDLRGQIDRIASLEHDLRQPLRAVQGHLATLSAEAPAADELIAPALAAAQRADRLINNLLDQARAEAHQQRSLRAPSDLTQLFATLQRTAPGLASYYTDPPAPIHFVLPDHLPAAAIDAEQLERAILNLLDNALAYSPPDGTIDVRAWATAADLVVEVRDMGPGIPEGVVRALFAGESPGDGRRPGLGLRQVYSMAQAHGGRMSVASSAHGTTVRITLPLNEGNEGNAPGQFPFFPPKAD